MIEHRRIKIGRKHIDAIRIKLLTRNFILLKGSKGYCMCGYLNLKAAERFKDAAIKITGVSTIKEALGTRVHSLTTSARRLGAYKGQPIKGVLKVIA